MRKSIQIILYIMVFFIISCGDHTKNTIEERIEDVDLSKIQQRIHSHEKQKNYYKNLGDYSKVQEEQLELNYLYELKNLVIKNSSSTLLLELNSKYSVLRKIFSDEKHHINNKSLFLKDKTKVISEHDDIYTQPFTSVYHPLVLKEVARVFNDFGDLYISEMDTTKEVKVEQPWSGYWLPFRDKGLYEGNKSPLKKFDKVIQSLGYQSNIAETEKKTFGIYSADGWEGLCDAWAIASVVSPEPKKARRVYGVNFSISDLKALQTFAHAKYPYIQYGITYRGDADTDGTLQDLKPEAFHKIVTHVLGVEKRAVVIDESPGIEIWNKPLYSYRWKITQDPDYEYAFLVKGYPLLVKQRETKSSQLTSVDDTLAPVYNYRLYVDKNIEKNGQYKVIAGQWINKSRNYHPGNVKYPVIDAEIGSHNEEFNKYLLIYKQIFMSN